MKLKPVFEDVQEFSCQDLYLNSIGAPSGNEIWKKKIGLPNYDETAWCIKTSNDGKLLISGNRRLHNNQSTNGAFIIKADTSGAIIWEKYFPSNYGLAATGMVELSNGDIVAIVFTN